MATLPVATLCGLLVLLLLDVPIPLFILLPLVVYAAGSVILTEFPWLLYGDPQKSHRKGRQTILAQWAAKAAESKEGVPFLIVHRTSSGEAPENTLAGLRHSIEKQAECVQIDTHLTKDFVTVVFQDKETGANLARLTGEDEGTTIFDVKFKDLRPLLETLKSLIPEDLPSIRTEGFGSEGQRLASFKEFLETLRSIEEEGGAKPLGPRKAVVCDWPPPPNLKKQGTEGNQAEEMATVEDAEKSEEAQKTNNKTEEKTKNLVKPIQPLLVFLWDAGETDDLPVRVVQWLRLFHRDQLTVLGTQFQDRLTDYLEREMPGCPRIYTQTEIVRLGWWWHLGLLPFFPLEISTRMFHCPLIDVDKFFRLARPELDRDYFEGMGCETERARLVKQIGENDARAADVMRRGAKALMEDGEEDEETEVEAEGGAPTVVEQSPSEVQSATGGGKKRPKKAPMGLFFVRATAHFMLGMRKFLLNQEGFWKHLRKRGMVTSAFLCNTEKEFEEAHRLRAVAVMTAQPSRYWQWVESRKGKHGLGEEGGQQLGKEDNKKAK
uniref:GP-PDE domain-containing protein n=1 Tax=Chromera velia CCMP2878 TaxID=1169474 RepID=A0A0G4FMP2_9ALVE|eukprot:Cvel_3530.t1-p1 / transcript=Cvel_3530.t1 / gene=Cvel_3530 / organism=Chromera_velia_CCMP2878 / gene_product=hypothetical protein / transcript_product=hypothetical protein / location=Cvel_scaffold143:116028-117674(+) / protein_length=549 / sequence_SO=supercontig / SO=protein_coding / is_pseudo=false